MGDISGLPLGSSTLSVFTNEKGGIIDDTIINNHDEKSLYVVSNAGCADKDLAHIRNKLSDFKAKGFDVNVSVLNHLSLVALQGIFILFLNYYRLILLRFCNLRPKGSFRYRKNV